MQAAPFGAQCALHAGVSASVVCARCGNFMCNTCSGGGAETQCPSCRSLSSDAFPYDASATIDSLWSHTTSAFQRDLAMCIVAGIIFFAFAMGGGVASNVVTSIINAIVGLESDPSRPFSNLPAFIGGMVIGQVIGTLINVAVQGVALIGLYRVLMDVLIGRKADLARMFSQLHLFPQYVALQVIMFFAITVPIIVLFFGAAGLGLQLIHFPWSHPSSFEPSTLFNPVFILLVTFACVVVAMLSVALMPVTLFAVPELIVGQCNAVEAIRRAWNLGSGQRLRVFGYSFVAGLITIAGALACGVGLLASMPLAYMLLLALYLALRNSAGLPKPVHA